MQPRRRLVNRFRTATKMITDLSLMRESDEPIGSEPAIVLGVVNFFGVSWNCQINVVLLYRCLRLIAPRV